MHVALLVLQKRQLLPIVEQPIGAYQRLSQLVPFRRRCNNSPWNTTTLFSMATSATPSKPRPVVVKPNQAQAQPTRWADANTVTFTGRVLHAEVVDGRYGEFLSLDVISRPVQDDEDSSVVVHLKSSNLVGFFNSGGIPTGRTVTVTGNLQRVESTYTKNGETIALKRPRIVLGDSFIQFGPKPAQK